MPQLPHFVGELGDNLAQLLQPARIRADDMSELQNRRLDALEALLEMVLVHAAVTVIPVVAGNV